jgi:hypothetical protein
MSRISPRIRILLLAVTVAAIALGAYAAVALSTTGRSGGLGVFNACIDQKQFLVLARNGNRHAVIETLKDRKNGVLMGEVTHNTGPLPIMLGGAAAATNRYVMSTSTPLGRDPSAIEGCWDSYSPVAPR